MCGRTARGTPTTSPDYAAARVGPLARTGSAPRDVVPITVVPPPDLTLRCPHLRPPAGRRRVSIRSTSIMSSPSPATMSPRRLHRSADPDGTAAHRRPFAAQRPPMRSHPAISSQPAGSRLWRRRLARRAVISEGLYRTNGRGARRDRQGVPRHAVRRRAWDQPSGPTSYRLPCADPRTLRRSLTIGGAPPRCQQRSGCGRPRSRWAS